MVKIIVLLFIALLSACSSESSSPTAPSPTVVSSSSILSPTYTSSSSSVSITYSSSSFARPATSVSSSSAEYYWAVEVGYICNGYNLGSIDNTKASEAYMAMYSICGNRATQSYQCISTESVASVLVSLNLSETAIDQLASNAITYGSSLYWYPAVDGYKRYIYFEECYDGRGLLKKL